MERPLPKTTWREPLSAVRKARALLTSRVVRPFLSSWIGAPLVAPLASGFRRKRISAMMRVKNEETFLRPSVESILHLVDEVVIIDNNSTDSTPRIARDLAQAHPQKIRTLRYPHTIARVGSENEALSSSVSGRRSPRLLANYYNWCMRQCRMNYILKWDGDMVATPALAFQINHFKRSRDLVVWVFGANVHPDRKHLVSDSAGARDEIPTPVGLPAENHLSPYTDREPRLYPRFLATYQTNSLWQCEVLHTPWMQWGISAPECGFLHLKYCKPDPYEHWSRNLALHVKQQIVPGPKVPPELCSLIETIEPALPLAIVR
jgi:hypothetical protein